METTMKIYKEMSFIETFDGEIYPVDENIHRVKNLIQNDEKFLDIGGELINKSTIKRAFVRKVDEVDNAIFNIADKDLRTRVEKEIKQRRFKGMSVNIAIFNNILSRLTAE